MHTLLLFLSLSSLPAVAEPEAPEVTWARVYQQTLPSLDTRQQAAERRAEQARRCFDGELSIAAAFPELAGAPLNARVWIDARLSALDRAATARLAERRAPLPALPQASQQAQLQRATAAAIDAEDAADQLERRLYLSLRSMIATSPGLERAQLSPVRVSLEEVLQAAERERVAADAMTEGAERDAALERARQSAEQASARLQRLQQILDSAVAHVVASAPPPDPAPELAVLSEGGEVDAALRRLALIRPFLSPEDKTRVNDAELAWRTEQQLPGLRAAIAALQARLGDDTPVADPPTLEVIDAALATARPALAAAEAALAAAATGADPLPAARREAAELTKQQRAAEVALLERQRVAAEARQAAAVVSAERNRTLAEEARRQADAASEQAASASERLRAELLADLAAEQEQASTLWEAVKARAEAQETGFTERSERFLDAQQRAEESMKKGALSVSRQADLDRVYLDLRGLVLDIREDINTTNAGLLDARRQLSEVRTAGAKRREAFAQRLRSLRPATEADAALLQRWEAAFSERIQAHAEAISQLEARRDQNLHLLRDVRELRRDLRGEISGKVARDDQRYLLEDINQEVRFLGPYLATLSQDRVEWALGLPDQLLDFQWVRSIVVNSIWLIVVGLAWLWSRRNAGSIVERALNNQAASAPIWRRRDLSGAVEPASVSARALLDVGLGYILLALLEDSFPELSLVLLVYLQFATYRLVIGVFELVIAKHPATRPALRVLPPVAWGLARRTLQLLMLWFIARQFTSFLAKEVLGTDVLHDTLMTLFLLAFAAMALGLLHLWEPHFRERLNRSTATPEPLRFLKQPGFTLFRAPKALLGGVVLLGNEAWQLANAQTSESSSVGRAINWISRRQMGADPEAPIWAPPPELGAVFSTDTCEDAWFVERPELDAAFQVAFDTWRVSRRNGRVVLIGDRGDGKGCWLARCCTRLEADGHHVARLELDTRLRTAADTRRWLTEVVGLDEVPEDLAALEAALMALPPRVWVIDGLELAFLRVVGGFDGLETLMSTFQRTGSRHFWILSIHRPAWRYLHRLRALFSTQVFPAVLELDPMGEAAMRQLIGSRVEAAGWRVRFNSDPAAAEMAPEDVALIEERAERRFFRLLSEASGGNPSVALTTWVACMQPGEEEQLVLARFRENPGSRLPATLDDASLFVLAAARIQQRLTEPELLAVTQLPPNHVRIALRLLVEQGIVEVDAQDHYSVPIPLLPGVDRLLKRRHLIP